MLINDYISVNKLTSRTITPEGYLSATAALTKVGVQDYDLSQITGEAKDKGKVVGVFRSPEVVFADATIESIKMKPITLQHPPESVNADNLKMYFVGMVGETVVRLDDTRLAANILVTDKGLVSDIQNGKIKQISLGYDANFQKLDGEYDGKRYQYAFKDSMIANHCAIVDDGRCGASVSILDQKGDKKKMDDDGMISIEDKKKKTDESEDAKKDDDDLDMSEDGDSEDDDDTEDKKDSKDKKDAKMKKRVKKDKMKDSAEIKAMVKDAVDKRFSIIKLASVFLKDVDDLGYMSDREILEASHKSLMGKSAKIQDKSDEYLMGILDYAAKNMKNAQDQRDSISSKVSDSAYTEARMYSAIEIQRMGV